MTDTDTATGLPDQQLLAALGAQVRARLDAVADIYRLPADNAEIWALADFMTPKECDKMMALVDAAAKPSSAYDAKYESGYRTSYSGNVDPTDPFIRRIQRRFDDLLGIDPSFGETIQGQRYLPGQEFQPHNDWFPYGTRYWEIEGNRGGQRSFTTMVFLNDVEEGGTTDFIELRLSIEPRPGALLVWNNARPDGVPNPATIHAGRPVVKGTKYIVTKWYRATRWF